MTAAAVPVAEGRTSSVLWALARLEIRQYARHPLYLLGTLVLVIALFPAAHNASTDASPLSAPIAPAFLLGVAGLIVAAQLTTRSARLSRASGAPPVPERVHTLAVACSFVVPALTATAWLIAFLLLYRGRTPEYVWWYGRLPGAQVTAMLIGTAVVAAIGGPALGLLISRWVRWRPAPLIGALVLLVIEMISQGGGFPDLPRLVFPWTQWATGVENGSAVYLPGNAVWWLVYAIGLTGLAILAAVWHDRTAVRGRLRGIAVVLAVLTVASLTLSMTTGAHDPRYLPVPSGVAAQHQ